jgi:hypothetical protein
MAFFCSFLHGGEPAALTFGDAALQLGAEEDRKSVVEGKSV